jgi:hypothetical protein
MRKLILIAVLVAAALAGGIAYVLAGGGDDAERRAGALSTGAYGAKVALQIDGTAVGFVGDVSCGRVKGEVQRLATAETKSGTDPKQVGPAQYEACELEVLYGGINPTLLAWITQPLNGQATSKTLGLQYLDQNYVEKSRLELLEATVTEVSMPVADASNDAAAVVRLTVAPKTVRSFAGSGAAVSTTSLSAKSQLSANFKFSWSSTTLTHVTKVESWSFTVDPATKRAQLGDLEFVVSEAEPKLATLDSSFKKFLIDGVGGDANETTATIEFLDPTMKVTNSKLSFAGVGWAEGDLVGVPRNADSTARERTYRVYVERATVTVL